MVVVCSVDDGRVKRKEEWRGGWGCGGRVRENGKEVEGE